MAFSLFKVLKGLVIKEENTLTPKQIVIVPGGTSGTTTTVTGSQTVDRSIVLPDLAGTLLLEAAVQVITNKTIDADLNTITDIRNVNIAANAGIDLSKLGDGSISQVELRQLNITAQSIDASNPGSGDITALLFSVSTTRSAQIKYTVFRSTSTNTAYETGNMIVTYSSANGVGNLFELTQERQGDALINFNVTDAGQVQYTCSTVAGTSHVGKITCSFVEFLQ